MSHIISNFVPVDTLESSSEPYPKQNISSNSDTNSGSSKKYALLLSMFCTQMSEILLKSSKASNGQYETLVNALYNLIKLQKIVEALEEIFVEPVINRNAIKYDASMKTDRAGTLVQKIGNASIPGSSKHSSQLPSDTSGQQVQLVGDFDDIYTIIDCSLAFVSEEFEHMREKVAQGRKDTVRTRTRLNDLITETIREYESAQHDMRTDGSIIVRIAEFNELFRQHKGTPGSGEAAPNSFYSNRFQTPDGFELRLRFFLNGAGKGKGTHISVFVQMCRTEFDEILPYPFQGICSVHLYDQNTSRSKKEHFTVKFKTNNSSCFQKPQTEFNPENGIAQFVSHEFLFAHTSDSTVGDKPIYMQNNVVFIGAEVKYSSGMPRLFASSGEKNPGPGSKKASGRHDPNAASTGSTAQLLPNEGAMEI